MAQSNIQAVPACSSSVAGLWRILLQCQRQSRVSSQSGPRGMSYEQQVAQSTLQVVLYQFGWHLHFEVEAPLSEVSVRTQLSYDVAGVSCVL